MMVADAFQRDSGASEGLLLTLCSTSTYMKDLKLESKIVLFFYFVLLPEQCSVLVYGGIED